VSRRSTFSIELIIFVLLAWILSACNTSFPPPVDDQLLISEPFVEEKKGFTIRYPQGWEYRWEDFGDAVRFFETGKINQQNILFDPTVTVVVGPIEAFDETNKTTDAQTILKAILEGPSFNPNSKAGKREGWKKKVERITVDGKDAAIADLEGTEADINFAARLVFVHTGNRGAIILGMGQSEAWEVFNPTFEAMLASMIFIEPSDEQNH